MPIDITLSGTKAERFGQVKEKLIEEFGYELSNPEVVGILMATYDINAGEEASADADPDRSGR